jgi:lactate dehydrogenase-like 2-hydroxyacid dehydrogenase
LSGHSTGNVRSYCTSSVVQQVWGLILSLLLTQHVSDYARMAADGCSWTRNGIVTPHVAWAAREARQRCLDEMAANIRDFLAGGRRSRVV